MHYRQCSCGGLILMSDHDANDIFIIDVGWVMAIKEIKFKRKFGAGELIAFTFTIRNTNHFCSILHLATTT